MSDQPKQINFTIVPADDAADTPSTRTYANFCAIAHTPFDFTLTFCEVMPLSEKEIREAESDHVVDALGRIGDRGGRADKLAVLRVARDRGDRDEERDTYPSDPGQARVATSGRGHRTPLHDAVRAARGDHALRAVNGSAREVAVGPKH